MALEVISEKLNSQEVKNFIRGKEKTDELLNELFIKLQCLDNVYNDAEDKQLTNPAVRKWLSDFTEAIFDAEDLLDKIKTRSGSEILRRRKLEAAHGSGSSTSTKVQQLYFPPYRAFDKSVDTKIEQIMKRLDRIAQRKDALQLTDARQRFPYPLSSTSLVEECSVYGRDEDKDTILKLLLVNDPLPWVCDSDDSDATGNKLDVIPIVGMGGIGKTTLAQLVYNDEKVTRYFQDRAWVCVSDNFDVVNITRTIYMSVPSCARCENPNDLNELQVKLKEALTGKKFLFVLDDVWNENYDCWDSLRGPFQSGACGSKIIVTTRNERVASVMGTLPTHHIQDISDEDCWLLFKKHAFENKNVSTYRNLEVIGRKIVKKCKGLPLAAKSLGGLLRSISNEEEWKNALESDIWELSQNCNILPALWLSYRYLPPHLKRCFAYCSIYPKDYPFEKEKLVLLWMAEDLLQSKGKKMVEEVGEDYFNDLISRSFFQVRDVYGDTTVFTMHDLVNDLAKYVSGDFCVRLEDNNSFDIMSKTRHFSYIEDGNFNLKIKALYEAKCMRTFLYISNGRPEPEMFGKVLPDLLLKLQCLRVLNLSAHAIRELPDSVSKLIHLRYLNLSYNDEIEKLPDGVCSLHSLQTLLLKGCSALAQLPTGLGRLIHLRHVDFRFTRLAKMPSEMCELKNLQTLPLYTFVLDSETNIVDLKELQELHGTLRISGLDNIVHAGDALVANTREKKYLTKLVLKWPWRRDTVDPRKDQEVLDNLRPHTNIRKVRIESYGGTNFPSWLGDYRFSNLVSVRLAYCVNCFSLPALDQLPALEELKLSGLNIKTFLGTAKCPEFQSLVELIIYDCPNLVCFPDGGLHAPNLRSILIICCPELESFPQGGLPCKLESLRIHDCGKLLENRMQWGLLQLISLSHLSLRFINCGEEIDSFPEEGLLPTTLTRLEFGYLSNLKTINSKELKRLISLQSLSIQNCPELLCLPDDGLPISLSHLSIYNCPLVTPRCEKDKGEDWPKIAHIPITHIR